MTDETQVSDAPADETATPAETAEPVDGEETPADEADKAEDSAE